MAFDFQGVNPYLSDETQRLFELISQQPQQPEQTAQPVEPPDTNQQINETVLNAANPQRPSYLLPQAPNPLRNQFQQGLLINKQAFDAAQNDQERQTAHDAAQYLRNIGNAAGIDLSAVGEGVKLQDAMRNLQTQQAQELAQMVTGRYSMTTDQFYESEYDRQIMSGASPDTAARRANRAAREYKASRMAYLNGLYNNYGRNGLVTNELGNQILLNLASDDPTAANFYGQIYPNAKDAYTRQNNLEDKALDQTNLMEKMLAAHVYNVLQQRFGGEIERQNYGYKSDIDEGRTIRAEQRKFDNRYKQIMADIKFFTTLVPGADVSEIARAAFGWKASGGQDKESAKTLNDFYKNMADITQKQINSIIDQYKNTMDGIPPEKKKNLPNLISNWKTTKRAQKLS